MEHSLTCAGLPGEGKRKPPTTAPIVLSADDAAEQALGPAMEWAKGYGRMKALADALTTATGATVSRQMVGRWLNPDPAKRVQTNLGMGLMLLHVYRVLNEPSPDNPGPRIPPPPPNVVVVTLKTAKKTPTAK